MERFMALAMSRVRIAPEAPTRAPATMRTTLPTTKPAIATAVPVKALRSEMTTGMSAPPIGRTIVTPKIRAQASAASSRRRQDVAVVRDHAGTRQDHHDRDAQAGHEQEPGKDPTARDQDGLALDAAHQFGRGDQRTRERHRADDDVGDDEEGSPAIQAGDAAGQDAVAVEGNEVVEGQQRGRGATHGVEERDELRHGGHGHGPGHSEAQASAQSQAADQEDPVPEPHAALDHEDNLRHDGDHHARGRYPVAGPRRGR